MANLVFYDFETCSSNVSYGQIIQAAAVLVNDNFQELDRYEGRCKLSPGIIPEAMQSVILNLHIFVWVILASSLFILGVIDNLKQQKPLGLPAKIL